MARIKILVVLFSFILVGCLSKTEFSESEIDWLNIYSEGDTLIFQSSTGQLDTSLIIRKQVYYPEPNPIEVHNEYLPHTGVIWYTNKALAYNVEGDRLLTIVKKSPEVTSLMFNYLYNSAIVDNLHDGRLDSLKHENIYILDMGDSGPERPRLIYWHEENGILRYMTGDSVVWERIN